jgi:hypothetical protein
MRKKFEVTPAFYLRIEAEEDEEEEAEKRSRELNLSAFKTEFEN